MRSDKKIPLKSDKKSPPKLQKKGTIGYNKKSALLEDAITQMNAGKYGRASSALKDLLALDPLNAEARRLFATLHLRLGSLMSARTAFESLAREAMERQDYWLAESLLREYLTAGPRCVPFLEMLGHVYEGKGDVMAAVAEYGKAVEVLLEDPDSEHPNRAGELFGKIRSIAPGSPVALRVAARFDIVTGQMLQAAPQPDLAESGSEPPRTSPESEKPVDPPDVVAMPWEDIQPTSIDPAPSGAAQASTKDSAAATKVSDVSLAPWDSAIQDSGLEDIPGSVPAIDAADSSPAFRFLSPEKTSVSSAAVPPGQSQTSRQNEQKVVDSELPVPPLAGSDSPIIEVPSPKSGPIVGANPTVAVPLPWDQMDDTAVALSLMPVPDRQEATEGILNPRVESVPHPSPVAEVQESNATLPVNGSLQAPEGSAGSRATGPLQVGDDVIQAGSPGDDQTGHSVSESIAHTEQAELPSPPVGEKLSWTLEVLKTSSIHPIAEMPLSPAPMPWDQIEERQEPSVSTAEPDMWTGSRDVERPPEAVCPDPVLNAAADTGASRSSGASFTSSSGLSWEDILAAVTAMQASSAYPSTQPKPESAAPAEPAAPEETASRDGSISERSETDWLSFETLTPDPFTPAFEAAPPLSAPMPWEQVEVEDVTIPRPDPEPEFGPVSADVEGTHDSSAPLSLTEYGPDLSSTAAPAVDAPVSDGVPPEASRKEEFCILPSQTFVEPPDQFSPIGTPVGPVESVGPAEAESVLLSDPAAQVPKDLSLEHAGCFGGSEAVAASEVDPQLAIAGSWLEAPIDVSLPSPSPALEQNASGALESTPDELTEAGALNAPSHVDELLVDAVAQETLIVPIPEPVVEAIDVPSGEALIFEQPAARIEAAAVTSDLLSEECKAAHPPEPEPVMQDCASMPEAVGGDAGVSPLSESASTGEGNAAGKAAQDSEGQQALSTDGFVPVHSNESNVIPVVPVEPAEALVPETVVAVPGLPEDDGQEATSATVPVAEGPEGGGPRILWDHSSLTPTRDVSTGSMLARWLRKPTPEAAAEVSRPATIPAEPPSLTPVPLHEHYEATQVLPDHQSDRSMEPLSVQLERQVSSPKTGMLVGAWAWRHLSRAAASLIGAGVSTTRLLVVLGTAIVGLSLAILAGSAGAIALTWLILEEQPSPAYRTMTSVPQHTLPDSQKNGYFLLLGFGAGPTQDPVQAGIDSRAEVADRQVIRACLGGEGNGSGGQQGASAEVAGKWFKTIDPAAQMMTEAPRVKSWVSQAGVAMGRYRQWLTKPFEDWGYGQPVSPRCDVILYAHRLYVAEGFAQDQEAGVARLESDITAWRTVMGLAKTMPVKMLASEALNEDLAVVSGLLLTPDLEDSLVSRLAKVARPLDQAEQSMRWPMQSQFVLATQTLEETLSHDEPDARPFYGSVIAAFPMPKQRRFNAYAQYYQEVGKAVAEGRYADLPKQSQFLRTPPHGTLDRLLNPLEGLLGAEPLPAWETYAGRVMETDARLRLVSLQAWLRRTPPEQDLLTRIAKAGQGLYDPFTGFPMLVNKKKGVLYSVGRDLKDDEARDRFDLVVQIPPTAWSGAKRTLDRPDNKSL